MRTGHGENVGRAIDQVRRKWLTAKLADVDTIAFTNLHCVKTRRLTPDSVNAGGRDFDIFAISNQAAEQALGNRAATNIAGANKEDAFHGTRRASERELKLNDELRMSNDEGIRIDSRIDRLCFVISR
jgi:hypothetical protein